MRRRHAAELKSVGIFKEDAEHRGGVKVVKVFGRQKVAQPVVDALVFDSQTAQVRGGLLGNPVESGRKELGLGAEVLKNHRLRHPDAHGDVGHARLLVPVGGEDRDGSIEDGRSADRGGQATASRSLVPCVLGVERSRAQWWQLRLAQPKVIVDSDLSRD